jgi:hypothetical protein
MYYDGDGAGGAASVKFAIVSGHPELVPENLFVGG